MNQGGAACSAAGTILAALSRQQDMRSKPKDGASKDRADKALAKFIIQGNQSISIVEQDYFKDFLLEASDGKYDGCCRQTVKGYISQLGQEGREEATAWVSRALYDKQKISITGDLWSSNGCGLFGIMGHIITPQWKMESKLLGLEACGDVNHTGEMIRARPIEVFERLGCGSELENFIFQKVADNGSNIVKGWQGLGCLCHTLELSINLVWEEKSVKEAFEIGKGIVSYFNSSTIGQNNLKAISIEINESESKLQQHCRTRWSSLWKSGLSLLRRQSSIQLFDVRYKGGDAYKKLLIHHWDIIGEIVASLAPAAEIVKQAEGDKYPTSSLVLPFVGSVMLTLSSKEGMEIIQEWKSDNDPRKRLPVESLHASVLAARKLVYADLQKRWVIDIDTSAKELYLVSSFLDPRVKALDFCNDDGFPSSWKQEAQNLTLVNLKSYFDFEGSKAAGSQGGKSSTSTQLKPGFLGSILSSFKSDPSRLCIPLFVTVHKLAFAHFMFTIDTCVIITLTLIC